MTLRQQIQTHVSPELGNFFIQTITGTQKSRKLKKRLGVEITTQAEKLEVFIVSSVLIWRIVVYGSVRRVLAS